MQLPKLNFSKQFDFQFRQDKDKFLFMMYCAKYLCLTPEEWVRQHWIQHFLSLNTYAPSALIVEKK